MTAATGAARRRSVVPSARLIRLAALLLALGLCVPLAPGLVFFWRIAAALLALVAVEDLLLRPKRGAVTVSRETARVDYLGRRGSYRLLVRNASRRTLRVLVHERLPAALDGAGLSERFVLAPGEEVARTVEFIGLERGEHALLPVGLRVAGRVGLIECQEHAATGDAVLVAPGRPAGETAWLLARATVLEQAGEHLVRRKGAEWEFESLREYVTGDELRRIDWKASARRARPMVREYRSERNADVIMALDCGRLMGSMIDGVKKLDLAMTPLLDLAAVCLQRGERVGVLAFDREPRVWLPARSGVPYLGTLTTELARLDARDEPTSYVRALAHLEASHRKRSLVLVFTDFTDEISAQDVYASLSALARKHVLMFVGVSDPHLQTLFDRAAKDGTADDASELFEKAVAGQLLAERARTLARIERLGVATLDAEPRRLSGPLIKKFLEVRLGSVV